MNMHPIIYLVLITALLTSPAWASCGTWIMRGNTEYHYDPEYEGAVTSSTGHATPSPPEKPIQKDVEKEKEVIKESDEKASQKDAAINETTAAPMEEPVIDVGGEWNVMIETMAGGQNDPEAIDLIIIQTIDRLQGYGNFLKIGTDLPATATGRISDDSVSLNVKQVEQKKDYRLDLKIAEERMEGSYKIYEGGKLSGSGNATASRFAI